MKGLEVDNNGRRFCLDCVPPWHVNSSVRAERPCVKHRDPDRNYDDAGLDIGRRFGATGRRQS